MCFWTEIPRLPRDRHVFFQKKIPGWGGAPTGIRPPGPLGVNSHSRGIKVVKDYISEVAFAEVDGGAKKDEALQAQQARQRAWLKRSHSDMQKSTWRPRKRHRKAAYVYSVTEHAALEEILPDGLLHFQQPAEESQRGSPFSWPRVSYAPDQGSDGVAAVSHWIHLNINCDILWDFIEHGTHNDMLNAINEALGPTHVPMQLIRFNVPTRHTTRGSDGRRQRLPPTSCSRIFRQTHAHCGVTSSTPCWRSRLERDIEI